MRDIEHLAVEPDRSLVGIGCKEIDHPPRERDLLGGWRKGLVDDRHLIGMNGDAAGETFGPSRTARGAQPLGIAVVDIGRLDCLHLAGMGGEQAL